jgi:hypothetical protein
VSLGTAPRVMAHDLLSYAPLAGGRNELLYTNSVPKDSMSVYFEFIGSPNSQYKAARCHSGIPQNILGTTRIPQELHMINIIICN